MPPSATADLVNGSKDWMADVVADARRSNPGDGPRSMLLDSEKPKSRSGGGGGSGWVNARSLEPPAGVALADRLMDVQDARDRAELIEKEARRRLVEKKAD